MATLYELAGELRKAIESIEVDEDGCIVNTEALDQAEADFEKKAEAVACVIKEKRAFAIQLKEQKDSFDERFKKEDADADRLEKYLASMMNAVGKNKLETAMCEIKFRKSESVEIVDGATVPKEFIVVKTEEKPDKIGLKAALKSGKVFEGITLLCKQSISIK